MGAEGAIRSELHCSEQTGPSTARNRVRALAQSDRRRIGEPSGPDTHRQLRSHRPALSASSRSATCRSRSSRPAAAGPRGQRGSRPGATLCGRTSRTTGCCAGTRPTARSRCSASRAMNTNGHSVDLQGRLVSVASIAAAASRAPSSTGRARVLADRTSTASASIRRTTSSSRSRRQHLVHRPELRHRFRLRGRRRRSSEIGAATCLSFRYARASVVTVVADDFVQPNGLAFSPDESLLYIVDTGITHRDDGPHHVRRFEVAADGGSLSGGEVFAICPVGAVRRLARRRARQPVAVGRRRRPLPRERRHPARQDPDPRDGGECLLRRPEAESLVHLRHDLALFGVPEHDRHAASGPNLARMRTVRSLHRTRLVTFPATTFHHTAAKAATAP